MAEQDETHDPLFGLLSYSVKNCDCKDCDCEITGLRKCKLCGKKVHVLVDCVKLSGLTPVEVCLTCYGTSNVLLRTKE